MQSLSKPKLNYLFLTNFERVTGEKIPNYENLKEKMILDLPNSLKSSLRLFNLNNINFLISKLNYEISAKELKY